MKFLLVIMATTMAFSVSAKTLTCTAELSSTKEDEAKFVQAIEWMAEHKTEDESLIPESLQAKPVKVDTRSLKLDSDGDAELAGIIVDAYETHGISYNYAVYARGGFITYIGAENEVMHSGSGASLKNMTEAEFSSSSLEDGSSLELNCKIQ